MIYYKKYKYFQKVQAIMNKKKSKNKKQDKQSEKPVPRKKEEEQTEGTGRNSAQNPCYGLLVCTGIKLRRSKREYQNIKSEYHLYTAWISKIKIQAVILIPACHWQIIIDSFSHQNLVQINNSVMEGCSTC